MHNRNNRDLNLVNSERTIHKVITAGLEVDIFRADRAAKVLNDNFIQNRLRYTSAK